jgi:hypothetical protein
MDQQIASLEPTVRPLIEQCRREIAAAWGYVEAAKTVLEHSRRLTELWAEQKRVAQANEEARLSAAGRSEAARIGMFVGVGMQHTRNARRARLPGMRAGRGKRRRDLEHDPEKWTPVFGKDHAPPKSVAYPLRSRGSP